ncbi:MAG: hypothetical protein ACPLXC_02190 [Candidatus Pacearchaeota archaeon]
MMRRGKKAGFCLIIIALFIAIFLFGDVKAGAACTNPNRCSGGWCDGSYCASYGTNCNCYKNGGCQLTDQPVSYERHCYSGTQYYYQGCADNQHPGGKWGPYACPSNMYCAEPNGQCVSTPPPCVINSITVTPQCGGNHCSKDESIKIDITYSGTCPATSYIQVDAMDKNAEHCFIRYQGGNIQGMETTCTSSPCTGTWIIPSIPAECKGKTMYAYAIGLYNNPNYHPSNYVTGKQNYTFPGFGSFDFEEYTCNSCTDCSQKLNSAPPGSIVKLSQNIDGSMLGAGVCIDWNYGSNVTFDCQGYSISGEADDAGISIVTDGNSTVKNCSITNFGRGIHVWTQNTTLDNNFICNNQDYDIYNGTGTTGSKGVNNTCDKNDGWNDQGNQGCTYQCAAPPTECQITGAIIKHYCGTDGCSAGESIAMNITVENMTKCDALNVNEMKMYVTTASAQQDGCNVNMINSTQIHRNTATNTYYANWTVEIPPGLSCEGRTVYAKVASLHNASGVIATKSGEEPNWFGNFTFAQALQQYNLSVDTCGEYSPYNGSCENLSVKGNITVNGSLWGTAPQSKMKDAGIYNISFGLLAGWYKPGDILVNLTQNTSVLGIYTKTSINYTLVIVRAKNETGHYIGATIDLYKGNQRVNESTNEVSYNYTGTYPVNFTAEFGDVSGYITPENLTFTIHGNGTYRFEVIYKKGVAVLPCSITNASIVPYCGTDGVCNETVDKIGLNITVENINNCKNVNKIEIDASSSYVPYGGGRGLRLDTPSECNVIMSNSTPIQIQGNGFIANWSVSVSSGCLGKTVYANKAKVYNGTNNKIGEKSGEFGSFRFANQIGGCYCVYLGQQVNCNNCISGTSYYCNGTGQIIPKCSQCNNCPSGTTCTGEICTTGQSQVGYCHTPQANQSASNCHDVSTAFCFWDKPRMLRGSYCEACFAVNGIPQTCFDYKNETACVFGASGLDDRCGVGPACLNVTGDPIQGATNCRCNWNGFNCTLDYTIEQEPGQHCNLNVIYGGCGTGTCGEGKRDVTYDYSNQTGYTDCTATDTTSCQPCGLVFRPLPFFEWWNVLVAVGVLIVIYTFVLRKNHALGRLRSA